MKTWLHSLLGNGTASSPEPTGDVGMLSFQRAAPVPVSESVTEIEGPIILNTDDELLTPRITEWLLRCIFTDHHLYQSAVDFFSAGLKSCTTVSDLNNYLLRATAAPLGSSGDKIGDATPLQLRLHQAVIDHFLRVQQNRDAYHLELRAQSSSGVWPNPSDPSNSRSLRTEFPYRQTHKFITRATPISSAGSCFAMEIAYQLQRSGYNYVITEKNGPASSTAEGALADASANWGIIFNTPAFRQLVERAFGVRTLPSILWSSHSWAGESGRYMDPFREGIEFDTLEEYTEDSSRHNAAARSALSKMKVFIITLGLNEVWKFKMDGSVFARSPWRIAPSFVEYKTLTVQENVDELQQMLNVLKRFNPDVKLIVTLSPIPLHATFLHRSSHVVEANTHSKAVLRVAAQEFAAVNRDVYYFPSYELITSGLESPWEADERHVKRETVERVMEMFKEMYVADEAAL